MTFFVGVTRFSVYNPSSRAWNLTKNRTSDEYYRALFDERRLSLRFHIFFNWAAPIYQEMSNKFRYRHIILYSDAMPGAWKDILFDSAQKFSVFHLLEHEGGVGVNPWIRSFVSGESSSTVVRFRVDDDDVLGVDYLENLNRFACPKFEGFAVSLASGYAALYKPDQPLSFKRLFQPFVSAGLAYIGRYDSDRDTLVFPRGGNHMRVSEASPTIVDARSPSFISVQHVDQDKRNSADVERVRARMEKLFYKLPDVSDLNELRRLFPTCTEHLTDSSSS